MQAMSGSRTVEKKDEIKVKVCPRCGKTLPVTQFYKNKSNPDGFDYYCKKCRSHKSRVYYSENRVKIMRKFVQEYRTNPKFRIEKLKYNFHYRHKNRDRYNDRRKERYKEKMETDSYWRALNEANRYY